MDEELKLIGFWGSPYSCRVIWALKLKGISFEYIEENLPNKSLLLLQLNPIYKKVPVLIHNGKPLCESMLIIEYIDELWPQNSLLPSDPYDRAQARFWVKFIDEKILSVWPLYRTKGEDLEKVIKDGQDMLTIIEEHAIRKGKFYGGEKIGIVDIAFGVLTSWLEIMEDISGVKLFDAHSFPRLSKWAEDFKQVSIIKESLPNYDKLYTRLKRARESLFATQRVTSFDEHRWVMQIRRTLEEDFKDDNNDVYVSIFDVPKALKAINPNAYTPQLVAVGPYHYLSPEVQEMGRYKVSFAKRIQNQDPSIKFDVLANSLMMLEHRIRGCYQKYLNMNGETLAWMMVIDASFLLEIINTYSIKEGKVSTQVSCRTSHLVDYVRRKSTHNAIIRDILMLENQIPLFVLREVLGFELSSWELADKRLSITLTELYKNLSPFKMVNEVRRVQPMDCKHLIDFFYHIIVPILDETVEVINDPIDEDVREETKVCEFLLQLKKCLGFPLRMVLKLPWIFICNFPGFTILRTLLFSGKNYQENCDDNNISKLNQNKESPLVEEIMIPSVVELSNSGVTFTPTNGDIMTVNFDIRNKKFYLPTIILDLHSEVLLRNIVAYETSKAYGSLVFTRYTELMNGIVDTKDDVKVLRETGIILNYLKSDEEVANLWNGMTKSLRLTRVPFMDEVIGNVNKYYEGNWKVRMRKFCKAYAGNSWQFLAFMVVFLLSFALILQTFCSIFYCFRIIGARPRR